MRIERAEGQWVLVDGREPSAARWQLRAGRVEIVSPSGRVYAVPPGDVPCDVAVRLLALRDAQRFLAETRAEPAAAFVLRSWLETSRDALLSQRLDPCSPTPGWLDYRFTFLAAVDRSAAAGGS